MLRTIQRFLERNRNWLLGLLLVVIVVPFVFTIGNMPGLSGRRKGQTLKVFNYDLSDRRQLQEQAVRSMYSLILQGEAEDKAWQVATEGYVFYRLWLLSLAQNLRLPEPTDAQLQAFIPTRKRFWDEYKQFQPELYNAFLKSWDHPFSLKSILREDCQCEQVQTVLEGMGGVLPGEVEQVYRHLKTTYDLDYWIVENQETVSDPVSESEIQEYYQAHPEAFRIAEQADVSLLLFDFKHYRSEIPTPSDSELKAYREKHKEIFKESSDIQAIKAAWEQDQAHRLAEKAADEWMVQACDPSIIPNSTPWKALLQKYHVQCIPIPPYTQEGGPEENSQVPRETLLKAFSLSQQHFLSDPFGLPKGIGFLVLNKLIPAHVPPLSVVKEQAKECVRNAKKQALFERRVAQIQQHLKDKTEAVGMPLESITALSMERMNIQELSKILTPEGLVAFMNDLRHFKPNRWSGSYPGANGSRVFFFCKAKWAPQHFAVNPEFKTFARRFRAERKQLQSQALANEIITSEIRKH